MQVQKPVRYYITKSGDEPTVRSVAVALAADERDARGEIPTPAQETLEVRESKEHRVGVARRVKGVLSKRPARP